MWLKTFGNLRLSKAKMLGATCLPPRPSTDPNYKKKQYDQIISKVFLQKTNDYFDNVRFFQAFTTKTVKMSDYNSIFGLA